MTDPAHEDARKKVTDTIQSKIMEIVLPIVGDMVQNLTQNIQNSNSSAARPQNGMSTPSTTSAPQVEITPEMIKAVQESMKK